MYELFYLSYTRFLIPVFRRILKVLFEQISLTQKKKKLVKHKPT
jgi:hypothetical protein